MRYFIFCIALITLLTVPVRASEWTAPEAPDSAQGLMPVETESFGQGLWKIVTAAVKALEPELAEAAKICLSLVAVMLLSAILRSIQGTSDYVIEFSATIGIGALLLSSGKSMISLAADTIKELSNYGRLLLPVMTGALAAQGGTTSASTLYAGTAIFDAVLTSFADQLLVPMIYMFLALAAAASATGEGGVTKLKNLLKWLVSWAMKGMLYIFTGYLGITGAITGTADAAAVKAAKLTISSFVPVVGGILSDASESVIVGAGVVKNAIGIYGLLAVIATCIIPFLQIGLQYMMLKLTGAICASFECKRGSGLIDDFSSAMGMLLGITGTACVLLLVSTVCFMKAVT